MSPDEKGKIKIKEAIIVEGKYDKIALSNVVDALIIVTNGFTLFNDKEQIKFIKKLGKEVGVLVLTDSDGAGLVIRNHIAGILPKGQIKHGYIPEIKGKERRKSIESKEGFLGVEGMEKGVLEKTIINSGATVIGREKDEISVDKVTMSDFMELGIAGGLKSKEKRKRILKELDLPLGMNAKRLLSVANTLFDRKDFLRLIEIINKK